MNVKKWSVVLCLTLSCGATARAEAQDVEAGIRAYTQGNAREAIRQIASALDAGSLSLDSRARAHYYLGAAFLTLGDTASAMPQINRALALYPCVSPPADAPAAWAALYDRNRPSGVSCKNSAATAILKSMIIPGWGQRSVGGASKAFFISTVTTAAGAYLMVSRGDDRYTQYQQSTDPERVTSLYNQAQTSRTIGVALGGTAAVLYLWNVVDVAMAGMAHDRVLSRTRAVTARPVVTANVDGVASFSIRIPVK